MRPPLPPERDLLKRAAVARAMTEVEDGMVIRLGSGSIAAFGDRGLPQHHERLV
jgi:ribose 5-phosphate isomerase